MTIILGKCGCACAPISKTISSRTHVLEVTPLKTKVYSLQANSIKYISYFHKDNIRICLRGLG